MKVKRFDGSPDPDNDEDDSSDEDLYQESPSGLEPHAAYALSVQVPGSMDIIKIVPDSTLFTGNNHSLISKPQYTFSTDNSRGTNSRSALYKINRLQVECEPLEEEKQSLEAENAELECNLKALRDQEAYLVNLLSSKDQWLPLLKSLNVTKESVRIQSFIDNNSAAPFANGDFGVCVYCGSAVGGAPSGTLLSCATCSTNSN